mmetsp:Transcript_96255/g.241283  ORF Transcript_96255/g.241283 Transcript_96255/m.241283 type:complete len:265 (-) Transcript_96255:230-1024(-)
MVALRNHSQLLSYGLGAVATVTVMRHHAQVFVPAPDSAAHAQPPATLVQAMPAASAMTTALLTGAEGAWAKGGVYGPLEGKASSLVHPIILPLLFLVTLYTGFLGWQWRQTRLVGVELADLRKQLPKDEDPEAEPSSAHKELKAQIDKLTQERSELVQGKYKDRHYQISSLLLGGGIFFTAYGVCNTYFRADKLFPGPHLYAGVAVCVLWALAAACVPFMEKGNETARTLHIGLNVVMLALYVWQLPTGFEILMKVWGLGIPWF